MDKSHRGSPPVWKENVALRYQNIPYQCLPKIKFPHTQNKSRSGSPVWEQNVPLQVTAFNSSSKVSQSQGRGTHAVLLEACLAAWRSFLFLSGGFANTISISSPSISLPFISFIAYKKKKKEKEKHPKIYFCSKGN